MRHVLSVVIQYRPRNIVVAFLVRYTDFIIVETPTKFIL
jgi:hypothetical protein